MIVIAGGDLVLPDRVLGGASLLLAGAVIEAVEPRPRPEPAGATIVDASDCYVVPGFVDVHVHGVDGHDTLDGDEALAHIARCLPRYGVTAFCPTTVACGPVDLRRFLEEVQRGRGAALPGAARILPAHLESNFINPDYNGAQPRGCLRTPVEALSLQQGSRATEEEAPFSAHEILQAIAASPRDVGIVTLAPELPGGIDLVRRLTAAGHRVSLGHTGADFETAIAAIEAGACHATHLFNRMTPLDHRDPGVAGAVLSRDEITAELICDGYHVHAAMSRMAIAAKGTRRMMAITDGTAASGLPIGNAARLGGRRIRAGDRAAFLDDGTLAGSTLTMDRAFRNIVVLFGLSVTDAAVLCATTPAAAMGLTGRGTIAPGASADLVVLDRSFRVRSTFVDGIEVHRRAT